MSLKFYYQLKIMTDRIDNINKFIDNIITQNEWKKNKINEFTILKEKYKTELDKYSIIEKKDINKLKIGGYVRYINLNNELKWGGILIKKIKENNFNFLILKTNINIIKICFEKNIIFYQNHRTSADKMREIFISYLDKYNEE